MNEEEEDKAAELLELDSFCAKRGFKKRKGCYVYRDKVNGRLSIKIDLDAKMIHYASSKSLDVFKTQGVRLYNHFEHLLVLIARLILMQTK